MPPMPPELPRGADPRPRWPAWYAPAGFVVAFGITLFVILVFGGIAGAAGADVDGPGFTLLGTLVQDAVLVATAVGFAATVRRPRPWHFGLRRARFWPAVGWTVGVLVAFYTFAGAYAVLLEPEGEQSVVEELGADESTLALIGATILVVGLAPFAEELFFRAFFYGALRTRLGPWVAAAVAGAVFGAIHYTGPDTLELLPVLAMLGFAFCVLYERTGSLYPAIALHAFNNMIAFSVASDRPGDLLASLIVGGTAIGACLLLPRLHPPRGADLMPA